MDIKDASRQGYLSSVLWALGISAVIIGTAAGLGRATANLKSALVDKPDIAIYLLLPDEEITRTDLLREREDERHYLVESKDGPKLVILKKGASEWYVSSVERLRE